MGPLGEVNGSTSVTWFTQFMFELMQTSPFCGGLFDGEIQLRQLNVTSYSMLSMLYYPMPIEDKRTKVPA